MTPTSAEFVRVAVPTPLHRLFDYLPPAGEEAPAAGSRVLVPFGGRRLVGLVVESAHDSRVEPGRLKPVERVLDRALVPHELLELLRWTANYYAAAPGEIVQHALPAPLRRGKGHVDDRIDWLRLADGVDPASLTNAPRQREIAAMLADGPRRRPDLVAEGARPDALRRMLSSGLVEASEPPRPEAAAGPELNIDQRRALAAILRARRRFEALLLAGVTGSGKTEVYLQAARQVLRAGRQVLVLVPEIGLTPQFVRRVENRLGRRAVVYHSGLADGARLESWRGAASGDAELVIGTRSAVFLPLARPGLIVVDEEHDPSFKQFDGMRYHARDVAVMRASRLGVPVVLGSATPSLESLYNARRDRYRRLELPRRAGAAAQPRWRIDDPRGQKAEHGLGPDLVESIATTLAAGRQVLVYRNRRGYAPVLLCNECGWQADCDRCSAHLTLHRSSHRLTCHHCGSSRRVPPRCPGCGSPRMEAVGAGTQRIEEALRERFPDTPVLRADRDALRGRDDLEALLEQAAAGEPCILVGTQMLAKGHHLPAISLSIMLDADQLLFSADFRAPERLAQSMVQVAGRSGRVHPGEFVLQTRHPDHPLIRSLLGGDYLGAAEELLDERESAELPPAVHVALVRAEARRAEDADAFLQRVRRGIKDPAVRVAGPVEAILQRRAGFWRYQLWLMSPARPSLGRLVGPLARTIEAMPEARSVRWHIDVDPLEV
ncbi:MAG: primosomal protein N' [Candidatus Wenzhouxiangella sp. M2_3B_020]